ncbi:hypothetical protein V497_08378, partial [Pseudogymnoascus sp. VKM F-4516 (FW-969)]
TTDEPAPNPQISRLKPASRPRPRLTNSAPPPSAAADLLRIQHEAAIEDDTLDDLADMLSSSPPAEEKAAHVPVPDRDDKGRPLSAGARERRLSEQQLVKMERGLSHGLESIRDAKRGIEKLEQRVAWYARAARRRVTSTTSRSRFRACGSVTGHGSSGRG